MKVPNTPVLRTHRVFFNARIVCLVTIVLGLICVFARNDVSSSAASPGSMLTETSKSDIFDRYGQLPLSFEENQGQTDQQVKFLSRGPGYDLFLTAAEAVLTLRTPRKPSSDKLKRPASTDESSSSPQEASVLRLRMIDANREARIEGEDELPGKVNYLIGNDSEKWRIDIPTYRKVRYREVYPGVDVVYYGNQRQLEYDFVLAPGVDPGVIKFKIEGADRIGLDDAGDLRLTLKSGEVRLHKPFIYQVTGEGDRREVKGEYVIKGKQIGFKVRGFDSRKPLIIDPVLSYATLLGGGGGESAFGIAVDAQGNAYVTGSSSFGQFPTTPGAFQTTSQSGGAFVSKMNATGSNLIYSTYLSGSSGGATGTSIAVDSSGSAFVTGRTSSADFPTANPIRGGRYNLLKTSDAGSQWSQKSIGSINAPVLALAVNRTTPSTIYAGTGFGSSGIHKSTNSGNSWTALNTGFTSAACSALVIDPTNSNIIYASLSPNNFDGTGVYKSTNGGNTWVLMNNGLSNLTVSALAIDPKAPATLYAGTQIGLFKTTNGGASWVSSSTGLNFSGFTSIVVDPNTSTTVYATAGGGGVFKTTNGAANWGQVNNGLTHTTVRTLLINPTSPATLFAGTAGGGVFKTTNGGGNWVPVNNGLPSFTPVNSSVMNPTSTSTIYIGTNDGGIYKTTNGGSSWTKLFDTLSSTRFNALAIDAVTPSTVYAAADTSSQSSNDNEAFVTKLNANGSGLVYSTYLGGEGNDSGDGIALDSAGAAYVVGETNSTNFPALNAVQSSFGGPDGCPDGFVTKLNAAGSAFVFSTYLGGNGCDIALAVAVDSSGNAYVTGFTTSSNFPTANAFQSTLSGPFDSDVFATKLAGSGSLVYSTYIGGNATDTGHGIAVDASGNAYITGTTTSSNYPTASPLQPANAGFAGDAFVTKLNNLGSGLVYSTYLGGSDTDVGRGIAVDATGHAYIAGFTRSADFPVVAGALRTKSPLFRSTNTGDSWSNDNYGLTSDIVTTLALDPTKPSNVYAGTRSGVYKSTDGGRSWNSINTGLERPNVVALVVDPITPATVYLSADFSFGSSTVGVFKSTDGGNTWNPANNGLGNGGIQALAIDPLTPSTLYAGSGGGVFKSTNGGDTWSPTGESLFSISSIAVDPVTPTTVYAAGNSSGGGVVKSINGGVTWQPANNGLTSTFVLRLAIDPVTPSTIYAAVNGGVFKSVNAGNSWTPINNGLTSLAVNAIAIDPVTPSNLYVAVGSFEGGVFKSTNGGNSWTRASSGLRYPFVFTVIVNPMQPSTIYAGTQIFPPDDDSFVTKIDPTGNALTYSTFLGGQPASGDSFSSNEDATAIALDSVGNAYVTGMSRSPDFQTSPDSFQPFNRGGGDAFIAKLTMSYIISGQVLTGSNAPVSGAEVVLNDGASLTSVFTEGDGSYEFSRLREGGTFTVSAAKPNFTMAPPGQTFNNLTSNQTLNFTATPTNLPFHAISGQIAENGVGLPGVIVTLSGSQPGVRTTNSNGNYSFTLAGGGNYTVTPALLGFTFSPPSRTFNNLSSNQAANFTATRQSFVVINNKNHGTGSLRQAILNANASVGRDQIVFSIPGSGVHTIDLLTALPPLTGPVVIDATTQPGYAGAPLIELNGAAIGSGNGFTISADGCTIRGFVINRFNDAGITVITNGNSVIQGNYIGIDPTGTLRRGNNVGIVIGQSSNNTIGGTTATARNVISSNSFHGLSINGSGNLIQGNFIGTNAAGTAELGNGINGVEIFNVLGSPSDANVIGGTTPGARNLISGNQRGISAGANTLIQGNLIGTDVTGTKAIGNNSGVEAGANSLVGGTVPGARNVISGNGEGVRISGAQSRLQGNLIGTDISGTQALGNNFAGVVAGEHALIGGTTAAARNIISANGGLGNLSLGHNISGEAVTVQGNYIGTDITGNIALVNPSAGIVVSASNNVIGGLTAGARNIISGNSVGIQIGGLTSAMVLSNVVQGNFIGLNAAGNAPLPNSNEGVMLVDASSSKIGGPEAGAANMIAFSGGSGVVVSSGSGNSIRGNSIFSNGGLGIDLNPSGVTANDSGDADAGANLNQNFPLLTSVLSISGSTTIQGTLNSTPSTTFKVDFYSNVACDPSGNGEGGQFFNTATVVTNNNGNATINSTFPASLAAGRVITATATDPLGNTSEFSPCDSSKATGSVQFSVSSAQVIEDVGFVTITVLRVGGSLGGLTVDFSTANLTAIAGQDYTGTSGKLTFGNGETIKTFQIPIINDATTEPDETFAVRLHNASNLASLGIPQTQIVTIQDRNTVPVLSIDFVVSVPEGNSGSIDATFTVRLSAATGRLITVNYATSNGTATGGNTCGNLVDYEAKSGTLVFQPRDTLLTIPVKVCGDTSAEAVETFGVTLSNPTNATLINNLGVGRIVNDDVLQLLLDESGPAPNQAAALESQLFVRDPFHVLSIADWLDLGSDRNTRVIIFAENLQLNEGEPMSAVIVNLVDNIGQNHNVPAENVSAVPDTAFTQVTFRLPNNLASGMCLVRIRVHGHTSNAGTFRVAP